MIFEAVEEVKLTCAAQYSKYESKDNFVYNVVNNMLEIMA